MKLCATCKKSKPLDQFGRAKQTSDGLHPWCRECLSTYQREWRKKNPKYQRAQQLKAKYDLTPEEVDAMIEAQGGVCAICREPMPVPCVDHSHVTGKVRGILCRDCNWGLGKFGDSRETLLRAAEYLS